MKTQETIYQNEGTEIVKNENAQSVDDIITTDSDIELDEDEYYEEEEEANATWKKVAIGSVIGVTLGGGAVYAVDKSGILNSTPQESQPQGGEDPITVEPENAYVDNSFAVDNHLSFAQTTTGVSFSEAFAQARSQVGAGGVFVWNGNIYGTYYANEWDNMSRAEKAEFGSHIKYLGQTGGSESHVENTKGGIDTIEIEAKIDGAELKVLGVSDELLSDGSVATVEHIENEGQELYLVDTDQNGVFNISLTDSNQNGSISDNEYANITEQGIEVDYFESTTESQFLANETSDYSNDDFSLV